MLKQTTGNWRIDARLFNSSWEEGLTLEINSFMSKCLYWEVDIEDWIIDGCMVSLNICFQTEKKHLFKQRRKWI